MNIGSVSTQEDLVLGPIASSNPAVSTKKIILEFDITQFAVVAALKVQYKEEGTNGKIILMTFFRKIFDEILSFEFRSPNLEVALHVGSRGF